MHIYILRVTSMTNCTVERKLGPELFPFVIRAIEVCIFLNNIYYVSKIFGTNVKNE